MPKRRTKSSCINELEDVLMDSVSRTRGGNRTVTGAGRKITACLRYDPDHSRYGCRIWLLHGRYGTGGLTAGNGSYGTVFCSDLTYKRLHIERLQRCRSLHLHTYCNAPQSRGRSIRAPATQDAVKPRLGGAHLDVQLVTSTHLCKRAMRYKKDIEISRYIVSE